MFYFYLFFFFSYCYLGLFFFQAEDCIRFRDVTGVQTCALPIYGHGRGLCARTFAKGEVEMGRNCSRRSEERRVGKGVDLGGRRIIKKKKRDKTTTTPKIKRNRKHNPTPDPRNAAE